MFWRRITTLIITDFIWLARDSWFGPFEKWITFHLWFFHQNSNLTKNWFVFISILIQQSPPNFAHNMTGMCKNLLWSDWQELNYNKKQVPLNLNCEWKFIGEMDLRFLGFYPPDLWGSIMTWGFISARSWSNSESNRLTVWSGSSMVMSGRLDELQWEDYGFRYWNIKSRKVCLTHCLRKGVFLILDVKFSNTFGGLIIWSYHMKLPPGECHRDEKTPLIINCHITQCR